jgi:hypothetical protein
VYARDVNQRNGVLATAALRRSGIGLTPDRLWGGRVTPLG